MITGYELIKKIQKEEIKSGTYIKYYNKDFDYEGDLYFNGNWFSKEPYYPGVKRYEDIILMLCDKNIMYEILEEDKPIIEKLNLDRESLKGKEVPRAIDYLLEGRINEIIDYITRKENK